jgi:hypothetical protein
MRTIFFPTVSAVILLLSLAAYSSAQTGDDRWSRIAPLSPDTRLIVEHDGGKPLKARFVGSNDSTISLKVDGKILDLPKTSISAIYLARRPSRIKRAAIGALAGAGAGILIGAVAVAATKGDPLIAAGGLLIGLPAGAAVGAVTGGGTKRGALIYSR